MQKILKRSKYRLTLKVNHAVSYKKEILPKCSNYCPSVEKTLQAQTTDGALMQGDTDILSSWISSIAGHTMVTLTHESFQELIFFLELG